MNEKTPLDQYISLKSELVDLLVEFHTHNLLFLERQSPDRSTKFRKTLKELRNKIKEIEDIVIDCKEYRQKEYAKKYPAKLRKKTNESGV